MILDEAQLAAVSKIRNGNIVCGGVGSGKSRVGLAYFFMRCGGVLEPYIPMDDYAVKDLYIITTAKKRDTMEWEEEMAHFLISKEKGIYSHKVIVDSWNNIGKYKDVENAFFIFDEDRVTGYGAWTKTFLKIVKSNEWIILSATPGDNYNDYAPVFIANGFYKNITDFRTKHIIYSRHFTQFPKIDRYVNTKRLNRLRDLILVDIDYEKSTTAHHIDIYNSYDSELYKKTIKNRWNYSKEEPIETANELCYELRRIANSNPERLEKVIDIFKEKEKVIIFYNFDYELELLKGLIFETKDGIKAEVAEWNGHKHQAIPNGSYWVYLVQYNACEGWNCIKTDTLIFFSQNYSYKTMVQAAGRIDRRNTKYTDLYYYHLKSRCSIDLAISKALHSKKKFNEERFVNGKN